MAKSSVKNLMRTNNSRLKSLRQIILVTNCVYAVVRMGVRRAAFDQTAKAVWALSAILYCGPYFFLSWAARPTPAPDGKGVVDGGADLSAGGLMEYAHDAIYLTSLAQTGSIFTPYAMLIMLIVPMVMAYSLLAMCCGGDRSGEAEAQGEESISGGGISRKERRKASRSKAK